MVRTNTAALNRVRNTLYAPFHDLFVRYLDQGRRRALQQPSALRSAANLVMGALATEINRRLGPLLHAGGLDLVHREPSLLGGTFQVALARKPGFPPSPGGV